MEGTPLQQLSEYGQSAWLDAQSPRPMRDGELQTLIRAHGIRGVSAGRACAVADLRHACDLLVGVWAESAGEDGYVSGWAEPELVDRPNYMLKIRATDAGLDAIADQVAAGVSVNATNICRLSRYSEVVDAYISGVARLVQRGADPGSVTSVASFVVATVDIEADRRLAEIGAGETKLRGRLGIANARLAYQSYKDAFGEWRWRSLAARGARPQRCCWISTSRNDPAYCDVTYVEELIGPQTITALAPATIRAFEDHGLVADKLARGAADARVLFEQIRDLGLDLEDVWRAVEAGAAG
jgi:transaldolase